MCLARDTSKQGYGTKVVVYDKGVYYNAVYCTMLGYNPFPYSTRNEYKNSVTSISIFLPMEKKDHYTYTCRRCYDS